MPPESADSPFQITRLFAVVLIALFVLHQASWLSADAHLIGGLPAGLLYHLGYCLLVSLLLGLFVYRRKG